MELRKQEHTTLHEIMPGVRRLWCCMALDKAGSTDCNQTLLLYRSEGYRLSSQKIKLLPKSLSSVQLRRVYVWFIVNWLFVPNKKSGSSPLAQSLWLPSTPHRCGVTRNLANKSLCYTTPYVPCLCLAQAQPLCDFFGVTVNCCSMMVVTEPSSVLSWPVEQVLSEIFEVWSAKQVSCRASWTSKTPVMHGYPNYTASYWFFFLIENYTHATRLTASDWVPTAPIMSRLWALPQSKVQESETCNRLLRRSLTEELRL